MKKIIIPYLLLAAALTGCSQGNADWKPDQSTTVPKVYTNPVLGSDAPEPSVIRADNGSWYLFSDNTIHRSSDLVSWETVGNIFSTATWPQTERNGRLGDCRSTQAFTTTIKLNGTIIGTTEATVPSGSKVTLGIEDTDFGSWEWWTGSKSTTITTGKIERDTTFTVTYINQGGAHTEREISIKVRTDNRPTSGLLYYHNFETAPDEKELLPDSMGYYPAMLCGWEC